MKNKLYRSEIYLQAAKLISYKFMDAWFCCHALEKVSATKIEFKLFEKLFLFTSCTYQVQKLKNKSISWFSKFIPGTKQSASIRSKALKLTSKCAKELNNAKTDKQSKLVLAKYKKLAHTLYEEFT